jgi:prephenate dehydratase
LTAARQLVGYPGPKGSHSAAATALLAPPGAGHEPLSSFVAVVEATVGATVSLGVLPIENSLHGPVGETHDLLYEAPISIVSEVTIPIIHCVAARGPIALDQVKTFRSHPVAFDQCRDLIHSLGVKCVPSASTSDAAQEVAESDDPSEASISSREAADHHGLTVIAEDVGDRPAAFTRFVGFAPYTRVDRSPRWRTALSFVTDHQPGSLYHALGPFHRHGLNLVQLVSRPIPRSTFRYRFDMILDGHPLDHEVQTALVEMREWTREIRIFGSYAATGGLGASGLGAPGLGVEEQ